MGTTVLDSPILRRLGCSQEEIDCGDATVIHLLDDPALPPADRVQRSYRPEFVAGADGVEVVTHRERVYSPRQVVARAYSPSSVRPKVSISNQ